MCLAYQARWSRRLLNLDLIQSQTLIARFPLDFLRNLSSSKKFQHHHTSSKGALNALPMAVQQDVIRYVDATTLLKFRHVNHATMELVHGLPEWE